MRSELSLWLLCALAATALSGCVTKSKADAQARAAYLAGQRDAMARFQQQGQQGQAQSPQAPRPNGTLNVTIYGDVQNPIVPWTPGLTLAAAILAAGYPDNANPTTISIVRNGIPTAVDPKALLSGADVPLQPGDLINIK